MFSLSVYTIVLIILISETVTLSLINIDKKNNTKEYKDANLTMNCAPLDISEFPNYFWYILGLGTAVLVMLIIHVKLYLKLWCPNSPILRRISSAFSYLWQHVVTWFRHFCLHVPRGDYYPQVAQPSEPDRRPPGRNIELARVTSRVVPQPQDIESISQLPNSVSPVSQVPQHTSLVPQSSQGTSFLPQHVSLMTQSLPSISPVSHVPLRTSLVPQHTSLVPRSSQGTSLLPQRASLVTQSLPSMLSVSHVPLRTSLVPQSSQGTSLLSQNASLVTQSLSSMSPVSQVPQHTSLVSQSLKLTPFLSQMISSMSPVSEVSRPTPVPQSLQCTSLRLRTYFEQANRTQPTIATISTNVPVIPTTIAPLTVTRTTVPVIPTTIAPLTVTRTTASTIETLPVTTTTSMILNPDDYINSLFKC